MRPALLLALALSLAAQAQTEVSVEPSRDATLYESETGALANGAGDHLFVGRTQAGDARRALVAFDVAAAVPAGATVERAVLVLSMNRSVVGATPVAVHRVTADWTEGSDAAGGNEGTGTSATGGATWLHTAFDTDRWATPGGDFVPTASATASVGGTGAYTWDAAGLVADVQGWLDAPASNAGWILIGDESQPSAKRFASRAQATGPTLVVTYSGGGTASEDPAASAGAALLGARPSPFGAATTIAYALDAPEHVVLEVFDALGRRQAVLVDGPRAAGTHRATFEAGALPEGVYLVRLRAGGVQQAVPVVRVR